MYNVACGQRISLNEVVDVLNRILGTQLSAIHESPRVGDIKHSLADIERAKSELGYVPSVGFEQGLNQTVEWYRTYLERSIHPAT
jgi:UDP-N-acetylglucosamine/UDP-N-acetyl-alpha-D-glucosaminouronate 4-epimerase